MPYKEPELYHNLNHEESFYEPGYSATIRFPLRRTLVLFVILFTTL